MLGFVINDDHTNNCNFRYLAIDETDRMLEKGHFEELQKLLDRINENEVHRKKRQNFIFSATLTLTHAPPRYVAQKKGKKKSKKQPAKMTPAQKLDKIMKTVGLSDPKIVDITEGSGWCIVFFSHLLLFLQNIYC